VPINTPFSSENKLIPLAELGIIVFLNAGSAPSVGLTADTV